MASALPISRLINVSVNLTPAAAQMQNISSVLILGTSTVIDTVQRMRSYTTLAAVATDFGTTAGEYLSAVLWFEQNPQPTSPLYIGRWIKTAASGQLIGAVLSAAQQAMTVWNAVTAGSFTVTIDGTLKTVSALNFSAASNLNAVASDITTALAGAGTMTWNSNNEQFVLTSATTGATSTVSFLGTAGVGTDISGMLGMTSTSSGAYEANGLAAETALAAVTLFDNNFGQKWYGVEVLTASDADIVAIAGYVEGSNTKHVQGVTSQEAAILVSTDTTNIAYQLKQLGYKRTMTQYSSSNAYAATSLMARALTVDYNANNSVITLMYKQEPGIVAETLNQTQISALEGFNANVFVNYNNNTAIVEPGVMASGDFIDIITGTDWLALDIQTSVYNLLYTSPTKIPQTDPGVHQIVTTIEAVCSQAVTNGLLAPGTWGSNGFGSLNMGDFMPKGFYVYAPSVATQSAADRAARISPTIQVAVKLAGAIHDVVIAINVNR